MDTKEIARILSTITTEQWEAILSLPIGLNECIESPEIQQVVKEKLPKDWNERELGVRVFDILKLIGVPPQILGYKYLHEAILMVYNDGDYIHSITRRLYPDIAKKFNTASQRVERAIRHAIQIAFDRGDLDVHEKIFKGVYSTLKEMPTNSECIAVLAEYIRYN